MRPEREPGPLGTLISGRCILAVYDLVDVMDTPPLHPSWRLANLFQLCVGIHKPSMTMAFEALTIPHDSWKRVLIVKNKGPTASYPLFRVRWRRLWSLLLRNHDLASIQHRSA